MFFCVGVEESLAMGVAQRVFAVLCVAKHQAVS
jgi:hypothetical protein